MPIIQLTNLNQNTVLAVWKITESRDELSALFKGRLQDEGLNQSHNIHWLASRLLIQEVMGEAKVRLMKDAFNKPSLLVDGKPYCISITHSFEYAAIIINQQTPVAVDLERIDERVIRVAKKFIRPDEMYQGDDIARRYTLIWSAKETLYKLHGTKELDFKEHLRIQVPSPAHVVGDILKEGALFTASIQVEYIDGYILTYSF